MSDASFIRHLRFGQHASATDWLTVPSVAFVEPEEPIIVDPKYLYADRRGVQRGNGEASPHLQIAKRRDGFWSPNPRFALRGLSGSGAGDGVATSSRTQDLSTILEAVVGVKVEGLGDTFAASPGSGTALTMNGTASQPNGTGVVIMGDAGNKYVAREVVSTSSTTLNIDRALTTDTGAADVPEASSVQYGMRTFHVSQAVRNRTHLAFDAEGENYRRQIVGCLGNLILRFPFGGAASAELVNWMCTEWDDVAEGNPTWATPTRGSVIEGADCPMWFGAGASPTLYMAYDVEIDIGLQIIARRSDGAPNGAWGYVAGVMRPTMSFKLRFGTLTGPDEVPDATLDTLRGEGVFDVAFQAGRTPGSILYARAPALEITSADIVTDDGADVIQVSGLCTDASEVATAALDACLSIHIG